MRAGPLHAGALAKVRFVNEGFSIRYAPGLRRAETRNEVRVLGADGRLASRVIGDNEPLQVEGYRFYTSPNKGFAPLFTWTPAGGVPHRGTIHLPSYPMNEYRQALEWTLPGTGVAVWTMLQIDEPLFDPARAWSFRLPASQALVLRIGAARHVLHPGERLRLAQGELAYDGLTTWMGYTVIYDWTTPWVLAALLLAVGSLALHFWRKFAARPWSEA